MAFLNNYKHNITAIKFSLFKLQKVNKIVSRSMFKLASNQGVNIRVIRPALHNAIDQRGYAAVGGRSRIPKEHNTFDKNTLKDVINNHHVQLITDFNLIYENPKDIQLYQIGTLYTNTQTKSQTLSQKQNYRLENKKQEIEYFKEPIPIRQKLYLVKSSKLYFDNPEIREVVESNKEYKRLFDNVLKELKSKNITVRILENDAERELTGLNVLLRTKKVENATPLMTTLEINNDENV